MESLEKNEKQKKWQEISSEAEKIADRLGMEIDPGIKETVIALKANDFGTDQSCEGHSDRGLPYPWVDIISLFHEIHEKEFDKLYWDKNNLFDKYSNDIDPDEWSETDKDEYEDIQKKLLVFQQEDKKECDRLQNILDEFYRNNESNDVRYGLRYKRLRPLQTIKENAKLEKEYLKNLSKEEKESLLRQSQKEMQKITEFLKQSFFA